MTENAELAITAVLVLCVLWICFLHGWIEKLEKRIKELEQAVKRHGK